MMKKIGQNVLSRLSSRRNISIQAFSKSSLLSSSGCSKGLILSQFTVDSNPLLSCNNTPSILTIHCDGSPDLEGQKGGGIGWVCRNPSGKVLRHGCLWKPGDYDSNIMEFEAALDYVRRPMNWKQQLICSDCNPLLQYVQRHLNGERGDKEKLANLTIKIVEEIKTNFPADAEVVLRYIRRKDNALADMLARSGRVMGLDYEAVAAATKPII